MSDVVKSDAFQKAVYHKLVTKVNNIDTEEFVLKTKCKTDKSKSEKKTPDVILLKKQNSLNYKTTFQMLVV